MFRMPFDQVIKISTLMPSVKVSFRALFSLHPSVCGDGQVCFASNVLPEKVDAMVQIGVILGAIIFWWVGTEATLVSVIVIVIDGVPQCVQAVVVVNGMDEA
jgi:hypothetical protein